jgi:asparagine synthetase B (glutamine-hydrolysing)
LVATRGSETVERKHWSLIPETEDEWLSEKEVLDGFEPALARAVERCMALAPQGIMLSGGVDSVTIAALASEYGRRRALPPLVAMSGRTGDAVAPDEQMQSDVAHALGLPHIVATTPEWTNGRDRIVLALEMAKDLPAPSRVYWVGTYSAFYRRAVAHGLHVVLSGAGGDNWLGVADVHAADLLSRFRLVQLFRFLRASAETGGRPLSNALVRLLWTGGLRPHVDTRWAQVAPTRKQRYHLRKWRERLPQWVCPDADLREELVQNLVARRTPPLTDGGRVPASYYLHSLRTMANAYMHYEYETAHHVEHLTGLRVLSPYHDRALVTFFNHISPRVLLHGTRYKGLLRPLVAKHLPNLGLENQRKAYPRRHRDKTLAAVRQSIAQVWSGERFEALGRLGVVNAAAAQREVEHVGQCGFEEIGALFALLHADRWVRIHAGM